MHGKIFTLPYPYPAFKSLSNDLSDGDSNQWVKPSVVICPIQQLHSTHDET